MSPLMILYQQAKILIWIGCYAHNKGRSCWSFQRGANCKVSLLAPPRAILYQGVPHTCCRTTTDRGYFTQSLFGNHQILSTFKRIIMCWVLISAVGSMLQSIGSWCGLVEEDDNRSSRRTLEQESADSRDGKYGSKDKKQCTARGGWR